MMNRAAASQTVIGLRERGELGGIGPNAMIIRLVGAELVRGRMMREVRAELMAAVKLGHIGRIKKDGLRPEAFFHPNAKAYAHDLRDEAFRKGVAAIASVCEPHHVLTDTE